MSSSGFQNFIDYSHNFGQGAAAVASGAIGGSGKPFGAATDEYNKTEQKINDTQNPFYNSGTSAIPEYQQWLTNQKDPAGFINNLMQRYQQSPYAKLQQQNNIRAAQNFGSATGLTHSTPLTMKT